MDGFELQETDTLRVLGLTLDKNLNYVQHIKEVTAKSIKLYKKVSRTARAHWGLSPEILKTIYISVVEPTMLYAANVWAGKSQTAQVKVLLDRVTRTFGITICKAHRTLSLESSAILAGILPLDLRAVERSTLYRVRKTGKELDLLPGREAEITISPYDLPHPAKRRSINYGLVEDRQDLEKLLQLKMPIIYTDGSKIEGKVGAALSCTIEDKEILQKKLPLASYCSVYQAEAVALREAVKTMVKDRRFRKAFILSDSRATLDSLRNPSALHPIIAEIKDLISKLNEMEGEAQFFWVKAHIGIVGNERADELAKLAATSCKTVPVCDRFPVSFAKRLIRDSTLDTWQARYAESNKGATTKKFLPDVRRAYRIIRSLKLDNKVAQLFSGHGGFRAYLHRFKLAPDPFCNCDGETPQTVEHVILECPKFLRDRYDCECRMDQVIALSNLEELLSDKNHRGVFLAFALEVVKSTARANGSTSA
ncbi:uncharacterized protein LOC123870963 [Maniola jurtina]|uniref:uncharacterized protein LOC123870962 n=1 Tax=Maniola jurtina TaxID=191418 RepID=UPI001E68E9A5|nr:uncharacterized protein LOC123870962 [Maniola jurtina]XP_045770437.1 uncharacterized protein LOC123870963 [Maniola jurtina]